MLKKKNKEKTRVKGTYAWDDPNMKKKWPNLYDHLAQRAFESKEERKTSKLSVFTQDGMLKCFLNDYEDEQSVCVSASSWDGLWDALEAILGDPDAEWRPLPDWEKKKKK